MSDNPLIPASALALLPRVVTRQEIIAGVSERYAEQYPDRDREVFAGNVGDIQDRLAALDPNSATVADVAAIIGNDSWTKLECDVCGQDRDAVVKVHKEYGDPTLICGLCADAVNSMLAARKDAPHA